MASISFSSPVIAFINRPRSANGNMLLSVRMSCSSRSISLVTIRRNRTIVALFCLAGLRRRRMFQPSSSMRLYIDVPVILNRSATLRTGSAFSS